MSGSDFYFALDHHSAATVSFADADSTSGTVVADLTGGNPNVYYEPCFSHSFGLPVVILIDQADNLPFDIKNERVIALGDEGTSVILK
jgi:hypothetical protein